MDRPALPGLAPTRPKLWSSGLLVLALTLVPTIPVSAQTVGTLEGRVTDPAGNPLPGALVSVDDSRRTATTDVSGSYRLTALPVGTVELTASYLGFEPASSSATISESGIARLDFELERIGFADVVEVEAEPWLEGQAKALNQQKTAINIKNIVSSDQVGRFPDPNAAEATQRISGITLQRDQGEGRYVIVRGTEARLNSMMVNGERIPSPEGDVRQVALDVIPADLLEAIEVSKALTPDMDGDAIGGTVNLVTRPAPNQPRTTASVGAGHNDQSDDGILAGNFTHGSRLNDGQLGVLVAGSALETDRGTDNFEVAYDDGFLDELELRDYTVNRERYGLNLDLDGSLAEGQELTFRGLWNEFGDQEFRRRRVDKVSDGEIEREMKDRYEVQEIQSYQLAGSSLMGSAALLEYRVSYASAEESEPDRLDSVFLQEDVEFFPNVSPNSIDPDNIQSNAVGEDLNAFVLDEIVLENNLATEEDIVLSADLSLPFKSGGETRGLWKFGAKFRGKEKDRNNEVFELDIPEIALTSILDGFVADPFFDNRYTIGRFPSANGLRDLAAGLDRERDVEEDLADYETSEDTTAAYGMAEVQVNDRATVLAGLRWESTDIDTLASEIVFDEEGDFAALAPIRGSKSYDELLPMLHLRYAIDESSNIRAAFTRSLARPDFEDLAPFQLILEEDSEIERGNPELDVTTSWNVDLMYERYFESVGVFSVGAFYKDLSDIIFPFRGEEIRNGETFDVIQPLNGKGAELTGFEIAYQSRLLGLEGWLKGLGIYFNLTLSDSDADVPEREGLTLVGQSETVGNFALAYERGGFSGRLSFNYQDEYLGEVGDEAAEDIYFDERFQIDFSASQRINDRMQVYLELVNLNDEPFRIYEGSSDRPIQEERYSWWGTIGLRFNF